jgi:hypothetical protein
VCACFADIEPDSVEARNAQLTRWNRNCAKHPQRRLFDGHGVLVSDAQMIATQEGVESKAWTRNGIKDADYSLDHNGMAIAHERPAFGRGEFRKFRGVHAHMVADSRWS